MKNEIVSFVIPAFNEENNIVNAIKAIQEHAPKELNYEIIVIDHGSTDKTRSLAKESGAMVFTKNTGTVASLRNYGASKASGDIFVFLDSDILLTKDWSREINDVISSLRKRDRVITGSYVSIPANASWIETCWFEPLQTLKQTHIGCGHMLISRNFFNELNGFDERLETGEDYDISMRAKNIGGKVIDNQELKAIHGGYPKNIREFMRREFWHGKGDATSIKSFLRSKVAVLSIIFLMLNIAFLVSLIIFQSFYIALSCFMLMTTISFAASYIKYKHEGLFVIAINSLVYSLYFYSRAASSLMNLFGSTFKKRER